MRWFLERPLLLVILAFVVLIAAWVALFVIAGKNLPEPVEIQSSHRGQADFLYEFLKFT